jgi:hypothetical protein
MGNGDSGGQLNWIVDLVARERTVLHVVFDRGQTFPHERVRLYVDGAQEPLHDVMGTLGCRTIDLVTGSLAQYGLDNRVSGQRGVAGTFYYASLYSAALDPAEDAHNSGILDLNDDGPGR